MSKLVGSYIFKKQFTTKQEIIKLSERIREIISCLTICSKNIREHTKFHILNNISEAMICLETEIEFLNI